MAAGYVRCIGWESAAEAEIHGAPKPRFRAIVEFPLGPPALPWSIVFNNTPVRLEPCVSAALRQEDGNPTPPASERAE